MRAPLALAAAAVLVAALPAPTHAQASAVADECQGKPATIVDLEDKWMRLDRGSFTTCSRAGADPTSFIGGPGSDQARGGFGTDTCNAEKEKSCER